MARRMLTDEIWAQVQSTMESYGCYDTKNSRNVMEAILWKLRVGCNWYDIPEEFCPWKSAYNKFNRWAKTGLWNKFFLAYEAKLIRSGYSSTEAMYALTSMQAELEKEPNELSDDLEEDLLQRSTWPVMRMDARSILKSLGVKYTIPGRPPKLFVKLEKEKISLRTRGTTQKRSDNKPEIQV